MAAQHDGRTIRFLYNYWKMGQYFCPFKYDSTGLFVSDNWQMANVVWMIVKKNKINACGDNGIVLSKTQVAFWKRHLLNASVYHGFYWPFSVKSCFSSLLTGTFVWIDKGGHCGKKSPVVAHTLSSVTKCFSWTNINCFIVWYECILVGKQ